MTKWKFKQLLEERGITAYALSRHLDGKVARNLPYMWAKGPPKMLHFEALENMAQGIEELSGKPVELKDFVVLA